MTDITIKRLILWTPTAAVGLWEYVRHTLLLPYLSMTLGNLLTPLIVFFVSVTLLRKLFSMFEETQKQLRREQAVKAALEEREQLARELHDGISQSLFLLSVKLDRLERMGDAERIRNQTAQMRQTVRHIYDDVRQSIAGLRAVPAPADVSWMQSLRALADELEEGGIQAEIDWRLPESSLSPKEKVDLLAIMREAVMNVRKHSGAERAVIGCEPAEGGGFSCRVADDGAGMPDGSGQRSGCFGIRMMTDRARSMGWTLTASRLTVAPGGTEVKICRLAREDGQTLRKEAESK
ncbi:sensor histidine kinase [Paenibacillus beijingensis]|uniref:histidine kinase n=1 Tax=Paenibacillus beijingensis TaxID=1126833 RepID=A0A0D5NEW2_9BACL|nr:histidine kinase [Paenibacillus beijingensis]AJY73670.1 histidine kinase [Paenibacillus beijingensis]